MDVNMAKTDAKTSRHHVAVLHSSASCGLVGEEEEEEKNKKKDRLIMNVKIMLVR